MKSFSAALIVASFMSLGISATAHASDENYNLSQAVLVTVDNAKVFKISRPANTVIIGNPSIVDATIQDDKTLILTGRSFGVTNLIILDSDGNAIIDQQVVVRGHETNTVRIYRQGSRETMACAPVCEPTLTIGDDNQAFNFASGQIQAKNSLSDSSSN